MSMATTSIRSRQAGAACASQYAASSAVRPCTCPSRPCFPSWSKKQVCHLSASSTYSPVCSFTANRARAATVLVDPQVRYRRRVLVQHPARGGGERLVHRRPGDPGVPGRLRRGDPPPGDLMSGLLPQPGRDPAPRRDLRQRLGERLAPAAAVFAHPTTLDQAELHITGTVPDITRPGQHPLVHVLRDRPAAQARRHGRGHRPHRHPPVRLPLHLRDPQPGRAEQRRGRILGRRGSPAILDCHEPG